MDKLPKGWTVRKLGELVNIRTGKLDSNAMVEGAQYPFFTCSREIFSIDIFAFDCEAILLAGNNASGDFNVKHYRGKFNAYQRTYVITVNEDGKILYGYLKHQLVNNLKIFKEQSVGANTKFLKIGMINGMDINLPPLPEQTRIVSKLDALFARINKSTALLEENIKHTNALIDSSIAGIFDHLANEYQCSPLLKYVDFIGGSQPPKSKFSNVSIDGYVRLIQIRDYKSNNYVVYIDKKSTTKFCNEDDVMIGRYGPPVFQILRGLNGAYNVALMKAVPKEEKLTKDYLYYFLQNSKIQGYIISISQRSAGQSGVNKKALEMYEIAIPPLSVQKVIVNKIKSLIDALNKLIGEQQSKLTYLKAMKSSLLDRAFKGEL